MLVECYQSAAVPFPYFDMPDDDRPTFRLDLTQELTLLRERDRAGAISEADLKARVDNLEARWSEDGKRRQGMAVILATSVVSVIATLVYMLLTLNA